MCGAARDPAGAEAERDVLQHGEVREQEIVLEHDADRSALGRHEDAGAVVEDRAVELDPTAVEREQPGERAQERGLAGTVRSEDRDRLTVGGGEQRVERERAELQADLCVEAHRTYSHRSRSSASTATQTASSTTLRPIATSGSDWSSR